MNSIHGSQDKQPNMVLVKQEVESDDVLFPLVKEEVHTLKLETMSTENKLDSPSPNTPEAKISSHGSLELKSEILNRDCDVESDANGSIKYEMVDIKSEDKTIQESHLDDKYNSGNKITKPTKMSSKVKPYKCDICDYSCARKGALKTHLRVHTGEKPFKCNICSYSCTQSGSVKIHLRSHTGEKPSKCNICDFRCRDNGHLKSHLSTHTGIKPFKCNICHYYTATNSDLKKHLRIHTGEKPFKCNICDYCCAEASSLKKHLRTHTGEKPFKCNICDYCGANHSNLKRHLRTHTKM